MLLKSIIYNLYKTKNIWVSVNILIVHHLSFIDLIILRIIILIYIYIYVCIYKLNLDYILYLNIPLEYCHNIHSSNGRKDSSIYKKNTIFFVVDANTIIIIVY